MSGLALTMAQNVAPSSRSNWVSYSPAVPARQAWPCRPVSRQRAQARPIAPCRIGISTKRYDSSAAAKVSAKRSTCTGHPSASRSMPGRSTMKIGQCHR